MNNESNTVHVGADVQDSVPRTIHQVRDALRRAGRFEIYQPTGDVTAESLADAIDAHLAKAGDPVVLTDDVGEPLLQKLDKALCEISSAREDVETGKHMSAILSFLRMAKEYIDDVRDDLECLTCTSAPPSAKPAQPVVAVGASAMKAFAFDALVAAGHVSTDLAEKSLSIAALAHPRPTGEVVALLAEAKSKLARAVGTAETGPSKLWKHDINSAAWDIKRAMDALTAPTVEQPGEVDRTAPERIYLQVDGDGDNAERDEAFPNFADYEVTWCAQSQGGLEVQYVRADLAQPRSVGLPDGWKLVPVDPTESMLDAVCSYDGYEPWTDETMTGVYKAMLAAAPAPGKE